MSGGTVENYLSTATIAGALLSHSSVAAAWAEPSALDSWPVSGLAGHLARAVFTVEWHRAEPVQAGAALFDVIEYYASVPNEDLEPRSTVSATIRDRGLESAGQDQSDLVVRYNSALARLATALPDADLDRPVMTFGRLLTLRDCLRARQLELVVHTDDLAVSVDLPSPQFPDVVTDDVIAILGAVAGRRRGAHAVVRALARSERVSGTISAF